MLHPTLVFYVQAIVVANKVNMIKKEDRQVRLAALEKKIAEHPAAGPGGTILACFNNYRTDPEVGGHVPKGAEHQYVLPASAFSLKGVKQLRVELIEATVRRRCLECCPANLFFQWLNILTHFVSPVLSSYTCI